MALIANNISGSAANNSRIGITGSVVFANVPGSSFPSLPSDTVFYVSGAKDGSSRSVFTGDVVLSGTTYVGTTQDGGSIQVIGHGGIIMMPYDVNAGQTSEIRFKELAANGGNYVALKAPDSMSSNFSLVLPNAVGASGDILKTNGLGITSFVNASTVVTGVVSLEKLTATSGLSGSLTKLSDGTSYLIAGSNISVTSSSNGPVTIANTAPSYFTSTTNGALYTTGSVAFVDGESATVDAPTDKGTDVFFYVSGSTATGATSGVSLFGGNVVISGSISGKNGATVTGDVFEMTGSLTVTSNLSIEGTSTLRTITNNLSSSNDGTGTFVYNMNTQSFFYNKAPTGNITANFTNVPTTAERLISTTVILSQSSPAYIINAVQIDGVAQTLNWINNTPPTGNANKHDVFGFSLIRSGSTSPSWTVLGKMDTFG